MSERTDDKVNILISTNNDYYEAARILLRSLFYHNRDISIKIYLFHSDLSSKQVRQLRRFIERNNGELFVKEIDDNVMKDVPVAMLSKETYYRLLAPQLLPENLDRILYLDIDMIVVGNIRKIYEIDFGNKLFMAVPDTSSGLEPLKKKLHMKKDSVYINAGVLLMNLEMLRQEFDLKEALEYAKKHPDRVPNCDQDVINGLYHERIGYLEWNYNYEARFHSVVDVLTYPFQRRRLQKEIKIIHYMGANKPWKSDFQGKFLKEYYRYAKHTVFQAGVERNMHRYFFNVMKLIRKQTIDSISKSLSL